jgi:CHASE2 domain-containing sensor protein
VTAPGSPSPAAPPELRREFLLLVAVLNAALLATSLGALVLVFWSRPAVGVGLVAFGVATGVFAWRRYRRVRAGLPYPE